MPYWTKLKLKKIKKIYKLKKYQIQKKLGFDQVIKGVGAEEEDETIEMQSDDEEENADEDHAVLFID